MKISQTSLSYDTHPGEFIRQEFLQASGQTIFQFAMAMQISEKTACEIIVGHQAITPMLAENLAKVLGIKSEYWLEMQATYDERRRLEGDYANLIKG
jgi:addiction module HigA family antidote